MSRYLSIKSARLAQLGKKTLQLFSTIPPFCEKAGLSNSSSGIVNEAASDLTTCLFKSYKKQLAFSLVIFAKHNYLFGNLLVRIS